MMQTKRKSAIEAAVNVSSGFLVAVAIQAAIYPLWGLKTDLIDNLGLAAVFTAASLVRSYVIRRIFNAL